MASSFQKDFPVPDNFPTVLHDFAREILRVQPQCIHTFGVEYFEKILKNENIDFPSKYNVSRNEQTAHFEYKQESSGNQVQEQAQEIEVNQEQENKLDAQNNEDVDNAQYSEMAQSYLQSLNKNSMKEFMVEAEMKQSVEEEQEEQVQEQSREVKEEQEKQVVEQEQEKQVVEQEQEQEQKEEEEEEEEDEEQTLQTFKLKDD